ncbi:MAG: hypothetical protein AAGM16_13025 [Pseudomonadota bacterium]
MSRWICRCLVLVLAVATTHAGAQDQAPSAAATLEAVGTRGWFTVRGPFATLDPTHPSVGIWVPRKTGKAPVIVYAHGGVVQYALHGETRNNRNVFFYGGSNGGRVILYTGSAIPDKRIRGIISEARAATGLELGDYDISSVVSFGGLDTWAGKSPTDFVWTRTCPSSPVSIKDWVDERQQAGRPAEFILYENAGHLLFDGPLEEVTVKRGDKIAFTAFKGAAEGVLDLYERNVREFVMRHVVA